MLEFDSNNTYLHDVLARIDAGDFPGARAVLASITDTDKREQIRKTVAIKTQILL